MIKNFTKFQSLGNDFILFDWLTHEIFSSREELQTNRAWKEFVQRNCNRTTGIGADGILVLTKKMIPHISIFNSDGSYGNMCLNGLRCVALYLYRKHNFAHTFSLLMNNTRIICSVFNDTVEMSIPLGKYKTHMSVATTHKVIKGHYVDVGNPHFLIEEHATQEWLSSNAHLIQKHETFCKNVNVSCIWKKNNNAYQMLTFERGCGITQACSSAIVAAVTMLFATNNLEKNVKTKIHMPGGSVTVWITHENCVLLKAQATHVFNGTFPMAH